MASNLLVPVGIVTSSMSTALFTTLPQLISEEYKFREAVDRAARYIALVVAPIAIALALFSKYAVYVVYGSQYELAPLYLSIMALSSLLAPFGVVVMYSNIVGATRTTMVLNIVNMLIGLPITWILLVRYGMLGAVVASVVNNIIGTAISLTVVRRMYSVNIKVMNVIKYLIPSLIAGALTYSITCMVKGMWLTLGIGFALYSALLVMLMVVVVGKEDLIHLANTSRSIKYIGPIIAYTLSVVVEIKAITSRKCCRGQEF